MDRYRFEIFLPLFHNDYSVVAEQPKFLWRDSGKMPGFYTKMKSFNLLLKQKRLKALLIGLEIKRDFGNLLSNLIKR